MIYLMRIPAIHCLLFLAHGAKAFAPFVSNHIHYRQQTCSKSGFLINVNGLDNVNGVNGETSVDGNLQEVCQESLEQYEEVMEFFMFELGTDIIFLENEVETSNFIQNNFDAILFDRDGVFCRGDTAIPEVVGSLKSLIKTEKEVFFMDDSDDKALASVAAELSQILDIDELSQDRIISSTDSLKFDPSRVLFITDRMDSVVKSAKEGGMKSALVLTGNTTSDKLIEVSSSAEVDATLPHIIFPHAGLIQLTN